MLIISELSMGGRLCTFHDTDWVFAGQFTSSAWLAPHPSLSAILKMPHLQHPWSWVRVPRSRNLAADVCLVSRLLMLAWPPVCVSGLSSLSVKLKIIIVIFRPRPKSPSLGSCQDPASSPCLLSAVCSASVDHSIKAWGSYNKNLRLKFSFWFDDIFRCEVSVNQRIPTHYRLPPLYLTWN